MLAVIGIAVIVAPTLAFDFGLRMGLLKPLLVGAPSTCPALMKAVERSNPLDQPSLLKQILEATAYPNPDSVALVLGRLTMEPPGPTQSKTRACAGELVGNFSGALPQLLDNLITRYTSLSVARADQTSFYAGAVKACQKGPTCGKQVEKRYKEAKQNSTKEDLRRFLADVGPATALTLLGMMAETPDLGYGKADTPAALHEEITNFLTTAVKDESRRTAWLLFVQDKEQKPTLRWRVACLMRANSLLKEDAWQLMAELLQSPNLPLEEKWTFYGEEAKNWSAMPDFLDHVVAETKTLITKSWPESEDNRLLPIFSVFENIKFSTPPTDAAVTEKARTNLTALVTQLLEHLVRLRGPHHKVIDRLLVSLKHHNLLQFPLPPTTRYLNQNATAELGLKLILLMPPAEASQELFRKSLGTNRPDLKAALVRAVQRLASQDQDRALALLSFSVGLPEGERKRLHQLIQAAQPKVLERLQSQAVKGDLPLYAQVEQLGLLLSLRPDPEQGKRLLNLIEENFTCEPDWTRTMSHLTNSGTNHIGFLPALFKLVSCPPEQVDTNLLRPVVSNPSARGRIQAYIRANSSLTPYQLNRLTEIYGLSNRIPGSSMPPKIQTPSTSP